MPSDFDLSRMICHVCGLFEVVPGEAGLAASALARFSAGHSEHPTYAVAVVLSSDQSLNPREMPSQRPSHSYLRTVSAPGKRVG